MVAIVAFALAIAMFSWLRFAYYLFKLRLYKIKITFSSVFISFFGFGVFVTLLIAYDVLLLDRCKFVASRNTNMHIADCILLTFVSHSASTTMGSFRSGEKAKKFGDSQSYVIKKKKKTLTTTSQSCKEIMLALLYLAFIFVLLNISAVWMEVAYSSEYFFSVQKKTYLFKYKKYIALFEGLLLAVVTAIYIVDVDVTQRLVFMLMPVVLLIVSSS